MTFKWNIGFSGNKYMTSYFSFTGLTTDGNHGPAELIQTYGANNMGPDLWKFTGAPIEEVGLIYVFRDSTFPWLPNIEPC